MILKTAANYNDEGGYIEAWKNSDGTTEVKLIPKSGGDEGKQGLKSISISPTITMTPALESFFPIYYEDLTEQQKRDGVLVHVTAEPDVIKSGDAYQFTITPTADWYVYDVASGTFGDKGERYTITVTAENNDNISLTFAGASDNVQTETTKYVPISLAADVL